MEKEVRFHLLEVPLEKLGRVIARLLLRETHYHNEK